MKKAIRATLAICLVLLSMIFVSCPSPVPASDPTATKYYVAVDGDDTNDGLAAETPFATIQAAVDAIIAANTVGGNGWYDVIIKGDIQEVGTSAGVTNDGMVTINPVLAEDAILNITFEGLDNSKGINEEYAHHIDASKSYGGTTNVIERRAMYVSGTNVTVTLGKNLIVTGGREEEGAGVLVENGATLIVDGAILEENEASSYSNPLTVPNGAGGAIYARNATVKLNSGNIQWNDALYGAGIYVDYGARIDISGSHITENTAAFGGGVYVSDAGVCNLYGGQIRDNFASLEDHDSNPATADIGGGAGVYIAINGTVNLRGAPDVQANRFSGAYSNIAYDHISLSERGNIHLTGPLTTDAEVGITPHAQGTKEIIVRNNWWDSTNNEGNDDHITTIPKDPTYYILDTDVAQIFKDEFGELGYGAPFSLEDNNLEYK